MISRKLFDDVIKIAIACRRLKAAKQIISSKNNDRSIGFGGKRPIKTRQTASGGITRNPCIDDLDINAVFFQQTAKNIGKGFVLRQTVSGDKRVSKNHQNWLTRGHD